MAKKTKPQTQEIVYLPRALYSQLSLTQVGADPGWVAGAPLTDKEVYKPSKSQVGRCVYALSIAKRGFIMTTL